MPAQDRCHIHGAGLCMTRPCAVLHVLEFHLGQGILTDGPQILETVHELSRYRYRVRRIEETYDGTYRATVRGAR